MGSWRWKIFESWNRGSKQNISWFFSLLVEVAVMMGDVWSSNDGWYLKHHVVRPRRKRKVKNGIRKSHQGSLRYL